MLVLDHDLDKDRLIQGSRQVHDKTAENEGRDHKDRLDHQGAERLLFMLRIAMYPLHEHAAVSEVDQRHEDQCYKNAASGAQSASHRAADRFMRGIRIHHCAHEKISGQNTDDRIRDLLKDL